MYFINKYKVKPGNVFDLMHQIEGSEHMLQIKEDIQYKYGRNLANVDDLPFVVLENEKEWWILGNATEIEDRLSEGDIERLL